LKHTVVENGTQRAFARKFTLAQDHDGVQKTMNDTYDNNV